MYCWANTLATRAASAADPAVASTSSTSELSSTESSMSSTASAAPGSPERLRARSVRPLTTSCEAIAKLVAVSRSGVLDGSMNGVGSGLGARSRTDAVAVYCLSCELEIAYAAPAHTMHASSTNQALRLTTPIRVRRSVPCASGASCAAEACWSG
jgi:hypothetical protein